MELRVLGPIEVIHGGQALAVGGTRARAVLAVLLLNANRVVSADRLASELWPDLEPERAAANLQVRLTELRRALRSAGEADRLVTRPPGYAFRATADELDLLRFEQLAAAGRTAPVTTSPGPPCRSPTASLRLPSLPRSSSHGR